MFATAVLRMDKDARGTETKMSDAPFLMESVRAARARTIFRLLFWSLLALYLLFALPIVGNVVYMCVYPLIKTDCVPGTPVGSGLPTPCYRHGIDIASLHANYGITLLTGGIFNPFLALQAIPALLPWFLWMPWLAGTFVSFILSRVWR